MTSPTVTDPPGQDAHPAAPEPQPGPAHLLLQAQARSSAGTPPKASGSVSTDARYALPSGGRDALGFSLQSGPASRALLRADGIPAPRHRPCRAGPSHPCPLLLSKSSPLSLLPRQPLRGHAPRPALSLLRPECPQSSCPHPGWKTGAPGPPPQGPALRRAVTSQPWLGLGRGGSGTYGGCSPLH